MQHFSETFRDKNPFFENPFTVHENSLQRGNLRKKVKRKKRKKIEWWKCKNTFEALVESDAFRLCLSFGFTGRNVFDRCKTNSERGLPQLAFSFMARMRTKSTCYHLERKLERQCSSCIWLCRIS